MLAVETAATLPSARQRKALRRPRKERGGAYRGGRPPARPQLVISANAVMFSPMSVLSVCPSVNRVTIKTLLKSL